MSKTITAAEAAVTLKVSKRTVHRLAHRGVFGKFEQTSAGMILDRPRVERFAAEHNDADQPAVTQP